MATTGGRKMRKDTLFLIQYIYLPVYAMFGRISHNKSSVHGNESFKFI